MNEINLLNLSSFMTFPLICFTSIIVSVLCTCVVFVSFLNLFPQLSRLFFSHLLHFFVLWLTSFMHLSTSFTSLEFFSHTHLTIATFTAMHPLSLLLHFHHSSLRELIASFFVLAEQRGNNGRVGLVVVATGMRRGGGGGRKGRGKTKKKGSESKHRGDGGC